MVRCILVAFLSMIMVMQVQGQAVPNCRDINVSVDAFGMGGFAPVDLITNAASGIDTVNVQIYNELDLLVFGPFRVAVDSLISIAACSYIDRDLKALIYNELGACWSTLTFKKNSGPVILGRTYDVYCFDELVNGPDTLPTVINACDPARTTPQFVADWISVFRCEEGVQDTSKLIYREWELFDKDGHRGQAFDTIVVFNIPEITVTNIYCAQGDTIYCTDLDSLVGPYITIPEIPLGAGNCTEIPLIEFTDKDNDGILEFSGQLFDSKCGLNVHIDTERFDVDCTIQYRITLDLKQNCYGTPQTSCTVPVPAGTLPNIMESVVPGYWRCVFWILDLDTLAPTIHCKDPVLFSGEFDLDHWVETVEGDADINYSWDPYHLILMGNDAGGNDSIAEVCVTVAKDTVIAFTYEYESQDSDAGNDPFGYLHNGIFYQLTKGNLVDEPGPVSQTGYRIVELRAGDTFCFSQRSTDGMDGRAITTIKPLSIVSTSGSVCVAHTYVPDVYVKDDWSGIKTVKATVPDYGTFVLDFNSERNCYESHERIELPHSPDPYKIYYQASDSCHNLVLDTCYMLVKDRTRPTAVIDKGVTVSLSGKKVWMDAATLNEGSNDNCDLNLIVVRRADWYEACVDLCDSLEPVCVTEHNDTLWKAILEPNKDLDEVEAHYNQVLWDWREDDRPCSNLLYNAWMYDLIKHGTLHCKDAYLDQEEEVMKLIQACSEEVASYFNPILLHPDPYELEQEVTPENDFRFDDRLFDLYQQIGGGWSDEVPFDCADACSSVTVEVLVMDYWCNWSKAWTDVWVEDKTPAQVVQEVEDIDITCKIYKTPKYYIKDVNDPLSIASLVDLAKEKDAEALGALDAIFGGYKKVWQGPYSNYYDADGKEVDMQIPFVDSACYCRFDSIRRTLIYDEHLGESYWKIDTVYACGYDAVRDTFNQGIVLANCASLVDCSQEIWCDIDHCGEGYLYRTFKIWQGCPPDFYTDHDVSDSLRQAHIPDTIVRKQRIRIYNECALEKEFFDVPADRELQSCGIVYDEDGSGNVGGDLHPDEIGWMTYRFDDDCRLVGVAYEDYVFKIIGGDEGCYKIKRTWYYMDWCEGQPTDKHWYKDYSLDVDSCVQFILLYDTLPPQCFIEGPVEDGGVIETGACAYNFEADISFEDACGLSRYTWQLLDVTNPADPRTIDQGESQIDSLSDVIYSEDLLPGNYKLKVETTDECNNEGQCEYHFTIEAVKKPTAICITLLTAKLNPMDRDQDGEIDTAMATIWASEVNQSSSWVCEDTAIELRLELLDGIEDDVLGGEADSLTFGCKHVGTNSVRMWVISHPSGTYDFCDIDVIVQSDGSGCTFINPVESRPNTFEADGRVSQYPVRRPEIPIDFHLGNTPADVGPQGRSIDDFQVLQNYPNPFRDQTTIEFSLPASGMATLSVFDLTGKTVYERTGHFTKGYNKVELSKDHIQGSGLKYYQIRSGQYVESKRMIALE